MKHTGGSLPMYLQIAEMLVREVAAGRLTDGEKLAPERDMAADLGIAVGTLRKALAELQERGLLERVQGSGNYIRAVSDPQSVYAFFRLEMIEGWPANGGGAGCCAPCQAIHPARLWHIAGRPPHPPPEAYRGETGGNRGDLARRFLCRHYYHREPVGIALSLLSHPPQSLDIEGRRPHRPREVPEWAPAQFGQKPGASVPRVLRLSGVRTEP